MGSLLVGRSVSRWHRGRSRRSCQKCGLLHDYDDVLNLPLVRGGRRSRPHRSGERRGHEEKKRNESKKPARLSPASQKNRNIEGLWKMQTERLVDAKTSR